ncbi:hypothetical protein SBV1_1700012 [Verrucomicrobia bacterium]|nr:hypothetical protein SBV1_1700012 [Verrucomicrobiota bacterium]
MMKRARAVSHPRAARLIPARGGVSAALGFITVDSYCGLKTCPIDSAHANGPAHGAHMHSPFLVEKSSSVPT